MGSSLVPMSWWGSGGFVALTKVVRFLTARPSDPGRLLVPSFALLLVLVLLFDPGALSDVE